MAHPTPGVRSSIPVLGAVSPIARVAIIATLAMSAIAIALDFALHVEGATVFVVSAIAILGLAWIVGLSTERLGALTGPQVGGILNATFGNIAELIIAFFALQAGLITVVKASLTGSIIGNLLLVLGAAVLAGGLKNGLQTFSQRIAGSNAALLVLAAVGLFIPAVFAVSGLESEGTRVEESVLVALVLMVGYGLSLVWGFTNPEATLGGQGEPEGHAGPAWTGKVAVGVLLVAAAFLAVLSEILVSSIEPFIEQFGLSELFVGVILIPTIGNLAEHIVAVQLAYKNKIEFAMAVTFGSSLQVALFVAPVLVLLGLVVGQPMDLVFQPLEIAAVGVAVAISALIALDGESNWLEGALLMLVYLIIAISFFELRVPLQAI
ncbi:MAG TPA: calcium/proton exchanger [Candidatus Limnocylindrales bacterium]|nr:calcium/proton exchanger [Candidatus Limnocylindrales bacterium]